MSEPSDQTPAAAGRGDLRASHADREQVIGILKAAFIQGRLAKDELDLRVGQMLVSRTYADLLLLMIGTPVLADRLNERFARQRPQWPASGAGGQAPPRMPPSDQGRRLPLADPGHQRTAETVRSRRPGRPLPGSHSLRRWLFLPLEYP